MIRVQVRDKVTGELLEETITDCIGTARHMRASLSNAYTPEQGYVVETLGIEDNANDNTSSAGQI